MTPRFKLRTLLIVLALAPPVLWGCWSFWDNWLRPIDVDLGTGPSRQVMVIEWLPEESSPER